MVGPTVVPPELTNFMFGTSDEAPPLARRLRRSRSEFGDTDYDSDASDECEFLLKHFPLTNVQMGVWHAVGHCGLRVMFATNRFVFVVVRRRRAAKPTALGRTAEAMKRHVQRHLHIDMPLSPFAVGGRSDGRSRDEGTGKGTNEKENEFASVSTSHAETPSVQFTEGATDSLHKTHTKPARRWASSTYESNTVLTYEIKHVDIVGLNYVNQLCLDGRLAVESKKVYKRAFGSFDKAVAFFSDVGDGSNESSNVKTTGNITDNAPAHHTPSTRTTFKSMATGIGRGGARRVSNSHRAARLSVSDNSKHKRARASAPSVPLATKFEKCADNNPYADSKENKVPSLCTPPREEPVTPIARKPFFRLASDSASGVFNTPAASKSVSQNELNASRDECDGSNVQAGGSAVLVYDGSTVHNANTSTIYTEVFHNQTLLVLFDDCNLPHALRDRINKNRRLLTLVEDGIPVWALFLPSVGVYYRPWVRIVFRVLFICLTVFSAMSGLRDLRNTDADGKNFSLSLVGLISGLRLGLVDPRTVRTIVTVVNAFTRSIARVLLFIAYVLGRFTIHRLSIAMAVKRQWRQLPKTLSKAHGFIAKRKGVGHKVGETVGEGVTTTTSNTTTPSSTTLSSPVRSRKPKTPSRRAVEAYELKSE